MNKNYVYTLIGLTANLGNYNSMSTLLNYYLLAFGMSDVYKNFKNL